MHRPGAHCFVRAMKRGNARGAKGAGHPRQDGVNGQPDELLVLMEGGSLLFWGGTSRMNREVHVRICGRLGVRLPGPTRQSPGPTLPGNGHLQPAARVLLPLASAESTAVAARSPKLEFSEEVRTQRSATRFLFAPRYGQSAAQMHITVASHHLCGVAFRHAVA